MSLTCERCTGTGIREITRGGSGDPEYDVEVECSDCNGTGKTPIVCLGQTVGDGWVQEWYAAGTGDVKRRARELRKLGFRVRTSRTSWQETRLARMNMTLLDARGDVLLLPAVRVEQV